VSRAIVGQIANQRVSRDDVIEGVTYDAAAVLEFADESALREYLDHPLHAELARLFWLHCGSTLVVDAEVGDPSIESVESILGLKT